MNKTTKISVIIMSVCEAVVGVLLLINPDTFTKVIFTLFGIFLSIMGIYSIVQYFISKPVLAAAEQGLSRGLLEIILGIFCIVKNDWFITTFPVLTMLYGIGILVLGLSKAQWTVDMLRLKVKKWFWQAISAVITLVCAVIILANPFATTTVLWIFAAVSLIVEAVVDIIAVILTKEN